MTPRSLVGMTMGARKRAALYESLHTQDTSPTRLTIREARMVWASVCNMVAHSRPWREQVRKTYRIGQRLRPCPGCAKCIPGLLAGAWEYCDGSGVLPAKRKVRR